VFCARLPTGCGKKVYFHRIFRNKFAKKTGGFHENFTGIFKANITENGLVKTTDNLWEFFWAKFAGK